MLDRWISDSAAAFRVKRAATLTTGAAPEPVRKGGTPTVRGKLSRAHAPEPPRLHEAGGEAPV
ncbi:hypothetical protein AB0K86_17285 [Streptomyces clavifer]|uniref:hypothetical protein n=1 Tax=Streptomyces TaxID=1883 RepID=UPI0006FF4AA9|nr:hypothetical protein [Streptomyces sp. Root55]KQZ19937.1 hypothetical protein ASD51_27000 [Streptomyces sp. Root55]